MDRYRLIIRFTYIVFMVLTFCQVLSGCGPVREIPVKEVEKVVVRDSIITRTDTVEVPVPYEVVKTVVPSIDTSFVETSIAEATAYLDTNVMQLHHTIKNKVKKLDAPVEVQSKVITIEKEVEKEVPVEVPVPVVPKWCWILLIVNIAIVVGAAGLKLGKIITTRKG